MKKLVTLLLVLVLLVSLASVAMAAGEAKLVITADKTDPAPGEDVTFTFTLTAGSKGIEGVAFKVTADAGLTYKSHTTGAKFLLENFSSDTSKLHSVIAGTGTLETGSATGGLTGTAEILKVVYTVPATADAGTKFAVSVAQDTDWEIFGADDDVLVCDTSAAMAEVTVKSTVKKGDVSGDGKVTAADYALVLAHVKGTKLITDPAKLAAADVNGDGRITAADYALILAHVKGTKLLS